MFLPVCIKEAASGHTVTITQFRFTSTQAGFRRHDAKEFLKSVYIRASYDQKSKGLFVIRTCRITKKIFYLDNLTLCNIRPIYPGILFRTHLCFDKDPHHQMTEPGIRYVLPVLRIISYLHTMAKVGEAKKRILKVAQQRAARICQRSVY